MSNEMKEELRKLVQRLKKNETLLRDLTTKVKKLEGAEDEAPPKGGGKLRKSSGKKSDA